MFVFANCIHNSTQDLICQYFYEATGVIVITYPVLLGIKASTIIDLALVGKYGVSDHVHPHQKVCNQQHCGHQCNDFYYTSHSHIIRLMVYKTQSRALLLVHCITNLNYLFCSTKTPIKARGLLALFVMPWYNVTVV